MPIKKSPSKKPRKAKVPAKPVRGKKIQKKRQPRRILAPLHKSQKNALLKHRENPIISPKKEHEWESWQTFNPAALLADGKVHLLYRAIGSDGISRLGYASSKDGAHIDERLDKPVFTHTNKPVIGDEEITCTLANFSGGSWSGCEDPRLTLMEDKVHMIFVAFDGYNIPRLAVTNISLKNFLGKKWKWANSKIISLPGIIDKSGVLFPEKINGKYAIMHRIFPNILIDYVDSLDFNDDKQLPGKYSIKIRKNMWDSRKIGAGAPPIKTKYGWLLIYYGVDDRNASQYKIGAMLLDLNQPHKVLYRTNEPILEPDQWYENVGHKSGVAYPCGAVLMGNTIHVYYGGADSVVCVANAELEPFLQALIHQQKPKLQRVPKTGR